MNQIPDLNKDQDIRLRPVTDTDREFLLHLYQISREAELSITPWNESQKQAFVEQQLDAQTYAYQTKYPDAAHDIILFRDKAAGRIYVERGLGQIAILDITVMPKYRKQGIGTALVRNLTDEARRSNKSVRIYLEHSNPSEKLFTKLGFRVVPDDGIDLRFEWKSDAG